MSRDEQLPEEVRQLLSRSESMRKARLDHTPLLESTEDLVKQIQTLEIENTLLRQQVSDLQPQALPPVGGESNYQRYLDKMTRRRRWWATALHLGASLRQLAEVFGVQHQTIKAGVRKEIPSGYFPIHSRSELRLSESEFAWWVQQWNENEQALSQMEPSAAAAWLQSNRPYEGE